MKRDFEMADLNQRLAKAESQVKVLDMALQQTRNELRTERAFRETLQNQLNEERSRNFIIHHEKTNPITPTHTGDTNS